MAEEDANPKSDRTKQVDDLLRMAEYYIEGKPVYDEMNGIHFKGRREKFKEANDDVLRRFYMAQRKLKPFLSSEGKLPITGWHNELEKLKQEYFEYNQSADTPVAILKGMDRFKFIMEFNQIIQRFVFVFKIAF